MQCRLFNAVMDLYKLNSILCDGAGEDITDTAQAGRKQLAIGNEDTWLHPPRQQHSSEDAAACRDTTP